MFGYPSWFRNRSIFFLSKFDKRFYNVSKISFKSQVKLGKFYVDFILEVNNSKIIVECDGKDYHDPDKDKERDKVLTIEGYKIFRFSGSRLFKDCDGCLDEIVKDTSYIFNYKYKLEELNEDQIVAVKHMQGPMRVLAPAGSGKTKTLVNRIVNLVNNGVPENEILALAFNELYVKVRNTKYI